MDTMRDTSETPRSKLAAFTFFATQHAADICGNTGLPLTPNSIAILGEAQYLKDVHHENLCEYVDFLRGKHDRIIVVSEYYGQPLDHLKTPSLTSQNILKILFQSAKALNALNSHQMVHHNLSPNNILLDEAFNVKLFNYGLVHMTHQGEYVSFPIGHVKYMAPERVLSGGKVGSNIKSDVWSLGLIILELSIGRQLWPNLKVAQLMRKILSLCASENVLEKLARENDFLDTYQSMDGLLKELLENCLCISPRDRFSPQDILSHRIFTNDDYSFSIPRSIHQKHPLFRVCAPKQIYYYWQLAGGDICSEFKEAGIIRNEAPVLFVPNLVLLNESQQNRSSSLSRHYLYDDRLVLLNLTTLVNRLSGVDKLAYFPLVHTEKFSRRRTATEQLTYLPLMIREKSIEYQFHRTILFRRLLKGYPSTRDLIVFEAQKDIPPLCRGEVWACLLGVRLNGDYGRLDKYTATQTDRQIEVDIPRCHQYDELLSSPMGHRKLKRLLKAWVTSHEKLYVYWQGLDSLTAPFLYLNFNDEERAFLSLQKFIDKYLKWFFLKDNSAVIKEYLSKFSQLTAFHEPVLAKHLATISFIPELFAIPWFLTMFSHVFPIHKILHLWDKLFLGDHSYPLYVGISILRQLKITLLASGFNECILLFSDLPDIVMESCVIEAQKMYLNTPKSVAHRKHAPRKASAVTDLDIDLVELKELQQETCPRISAADLIQLVSEGGDEAVAVLDLRNKMEFRRSHIYNSINIPFTSISLGDVRLEALGVANLEQVLQRKIVVVVNTMHENAVLFSHFLISCKVAKVCVLHKGFQVLAECFPSILTSAA